MESQESSVEIFQKFTWKIDNFSHLKAKEIHSEPFLLGGYPWRISLFPKGGDLDDDSLSIYLEVMQTANMFEGWTRDVKLKLLVFNQLDTKMTITEESNQEFNANACSCGFPCFMPLVELQDLQNGYIVKDVCIVGAEVFVCKATLENQVNQAANVTVSLTAGSQTGHMKIEVPMPNPEVQDPAMETISPVSASVCIESAKNTNAELFSPSIQELLDFSSVGQIEEVCSHHPSLNEPQPKRSRNFTDLAFAALGRVLYFLKTKKVKEMNDQACKDLQVLWEELEKFRFDLTWLEPHVQSALGMKSYVEKVIEVEKLKENVVALELETERLKAKLVTAEVNLDIERNLLKAKGFNERRDLDSKLGCGS